ASAADMWLNEGWATFCQMFYKNDVYSEAIYKVDMMYNLREVLRNTHFIDGGYLALYGISHQYTYGSTVYDKGATVVQSLRAYLGDDVFFPAIQEYLNTYAYNYASSENMRDFLTSYTGVDMNDFFEAYVFTPGFSHFSVDSLHLVDGSTSDYQIHMKQKLKGKEVFADHNIVDVSLMDENWNQHLVRVHFDGESGFETFDLPFQPIVSMVDVDRNFSDATTDEVKVITEVGAYNFSDCYFQLEVESIVDSSYFRVTHNWVAPDDLNPPVEGLTLSDYRYYSIEGILPSSLQATGVFRYSISSKLDHTLLGNPLDSLIILYRPDASHNWSAIPFERDGTPFIGYLRVPNIQTGDYTLAIWDEQFVIIHEDIKLTPEDYLQCYPTPSTGRVFFELILKEEAQLEIYDTTGKKIDTILLQANQESAKWDGRKMPRGTYFVKLMSKKGKELSQQKIILQ
ncbi:MAG: T9SS type A sorting domain-containing protein, partial [Bacteroidales bacterium]|nr:T9SS type A sorting domain-containing protein [Bacteroidales bacterium]